MEEFKAQLKELKLKLKTAEKRAIIAEKMVKVFSKELDAREGTYQEHFSSQHLLITSSLRILIAVFQISCSGKKRSSSTSATTWTPPSPNSPATN